MIYKKSINLNDDCIACNNGTTHCIYELLCPKYCMTQSERKYPQKLMIEWNRCLKQLGKVSTNPFVHAERVL